MATTCLHAWLVLSIKLLLCNFCLAVVMCAIKMLEKFRCMVSIRLFNRFLYFVETLRQQIHMVATEPPCKSQWSYLLSTPNSAKARKVKFLGMFLHCFMTHHFEAKESFIFRK